MTDFLSRLRGFVAVGVLTVVTLVLIPVQWLAVRFGWRLAGTLPVFWHRLALGLVGVRVVVRGTPTANRPLLIAANHVSWLDISVLGSLIPLSFIAKAEVESWPVFGLFAVLQRTVFVNRERRAETAAVASRIAERLSRGDPMVLFAEGTSSNGNEVLPFRTALMGAARHALDADGAGAWVQPLSIAYTHRHGMPMGRMGRPSVAWYGDMDLAPHLWGVFSSGAIDVTVTWGTPIAFAADGDRKRVAAAAEQAVRAMTLAALTGREAEAAPIAAPVESVVPPSSTAPILKSHETV